MSNILNLGEAFHFLGTSLNLIGFIRLKNGAPTKSSPSMSALKKLRKPGLVLQGTRVEDAPASAPFKEPKRVKGVYLLNQPTASRKRKLRARVRLGGEVINLGTFDSERVATMAVLNVIGEDRS